MMIFGEKTPTYEASVFVVGVDGMECWENQVYSGEGGIFLGPGKSTA